MALFHTACIAACSVALARTGVGYYGLECQDFFGQKMFFFCHSSSKLHTAVQSSAILSILLTKYKESKAWRVSVAEMHGCNQWMGWLTMTKSIKKTLSHINSQLFPLFVAIHIFLDNCTVFLWFRQCNKLYVEPRNMIHGYFFSVAVCQLMCWAEMLWCYSEGFPSSNFFSWWSTSLAFSCIAWYIASLSKRVEFEVGLHLCSNNMTAQMCETYWNMEKECKQYYWSTYLHLLDKISERMYFSGTINSPPILTQVAFLTWVQTIVIFIYLFIFI